MEKIVQTFASHAEADDAFYALLTGSQRLEILWKLNPPRRNECN
jgi:hypothetical protein